MKTPRFAHLAVALLLAPTIASAQSTSCEDVPEGVFALHDNGFENTGKTVKDHITGLEWQRTDDDGGLTDKDASYSFSSSGLVDGVAQRDGTVFTQFLAGLNECRLFNAETTGGFADHCDWRLPTREELATIMDCPENGGPCLDPVFGPVNADFYTWTALPANADQNYIVTSNDTNGSFPTYAAGAALYARAVRGTMGVVPADKFRSEALGAVGMLANLTCFVGDPACGCYSAIVDETQSTGQRLDWMAKMTEILDSNRGCRANAPKRSLSGIAQEAAGALCDQSANP